MPVLLTNAQKQIEQHRNGPLVIVGSPGAGKTVGIGALLASLLRDSNETFRILVLTPSLQTSVEVAGTLQSGMKKRATVEVFENFCMDVLKSRGKHIGITVQQVVTHDERLQLLGNVIFSNPKMKVWLEEWMERDGFVNVNMFLNVQLNKIRTFKRQAVLPEMVLDPADSDCYEAYERALHGANLLDRDDLPLLTYRLFAERPAIADFYRDLYRYLIIDDANQMTKAEYRLVQAIRTKNIVFAGREDHRIWHAEASVTMREIATDYNVGLLQMETDFKHAKAVIERARLLVPELEIKEEFPIEGETKLLVAEDEEGEARQVLGKLQHLMKMGHPDLEDRLTWSHVAIVSQDRYVLFQLKQELMRWNIPFIQTYLKQRNETLLFDALELSLYVLNSFDSLHGLMLVSLWKQNVVDFDVNEFAAGIDLIRSLRGKGRDPQLLAALDVVEKLVESEQEFNLMQALEGIRQFADHMKDERQKALLLADLDRWEDLYQYARNQVDAKVKFLPSFVNLLKHDLYRWSHRDCVALHTFESLSNAEYDVVVVMGLNDAEAVEQSSLFQAMVRARRLLWFSYSKTRLMPSGEIEPQEPSRYLRKMKLLS